MGVSKYSLGCAVALALLPAVAQAQSEDVRTVLPPPIIIPAPAPPVLRSSVPQRTTTLAVQVFGGPEELWKRTLVLRGYNGAKATVEVSEASSCPDDNEGYNGSRRTGLKLLLGQRG